jgi:hypothetical protein
MPPVVHGSVVRFGVRCIYPLDPPEEIGWSLPVLNPKGSVSGSVEENSRTGKAEKGVTLLGVAEDEIAAVAWVENPRVGGSIPPQATKEMRD